MRMNTCWLAQRKKIAILVLINGSFSVHINNMERQSFSRGVIFFYVYLPIARFPTMNFLHQITANQL